MQAPIVVMIDSLDQLSDLDDGRSQPWRWLPLQLASPHASVLVSTLPDARYGILASLRNNLPPENFMSVPQLAPEEVRCASCRM
jgi:hypothetical protein